MKPDQPLFLARKLESLAKWFEPTDYQKEAGRIRMVLSAKDYEGAVAMLKEACDQLDRYQRLLSATCDKTPEKRGPRGPRPSVTAEEMENAT